MQGIREFNKKITSLKNTRKITSSMKMISSVKLQRYAKQKQLANPYWVATDSVLKRIGAVVDSPHILCHGYQDVKTVLVLLFSSDRGLCGRFNTNVIRLALQQHESCSSQNQKCLFSFVGTKGYAFFKRRKMHIGKMYEGASSPDYTYASRIADDLHDLYVNGDVQEIRLVYTRKGSTSEEPCVERLLPFGVEIDEKGSSQNVLVEENGVELLQRYARTALKSKIYKAHMESTVSEHAARMSAMDSATSNCDQMIQNYIKLRNRARQTAITTELSEIVSGKEAIDN